MHAIDPQLSDRELVALTLQGARDAFGLLVQRHSRTVRAACVSRTGLHHELDDMVQEVFLRAFHGLNRLKTADSFGSYVHKIAVNLSVDRLRRRSHRGVSLDEIELDPAADTPTSDVEEHLGKLRREVGRLPESLREVVLLFYFQDMSYAEMARLLGITEAAVNQRLNRARQRLRDGFGVEQEGGV